MDFTLEKEVVIGRKGALDDQEEVQTFIFENVFRMGFFIHIQCSWNVGHLWKNSSPTISLRIQRGKVFIQEISTSLHNRPYTDRLEVKLDERRYLWLTVKHGTVTTAKGDLDGLLGWNINLEVTTQSRSVFLKNSTHKPPSMNTDSALRPTS